MAIELLRNHHISDFVIVEKGGGFGGTYSVSEHPLDSNED